MATVLEVKNLQTQFNIEAGVVKEAEHDMVVLSVGVLPNQGISEVFDNDVLELDPFNFINQSDILASPAKTSIDGVFVSGTASGPMDIPDSILSGGAASAETTSYLRRALL